MERQGIELDFGPNEDLPKGEDDKHPSTVLTCARAGGANDRFAKALEQKYRPYRTQIDNDTMDEKVASDLLAEAFAETIILGWKGVSSLDIGLTEEGEDVYEVNFSKEYCTMMFINLPEHFKDVRTQTMKFTNFRKAEMEQDVKN